MIRLFLLVGGLIWGRPLCLSGQTNLDPVAPPFAVGERLEYDLSWGFFPVGSAVMEVLEAMENQSEGAKTIRFQVRSNSFADNFYKVRTSISSTVDADFTKSLLYQKSQREGRTRREIRVEYDYANGVARYFSEAEEQKTTPIPESVFDPLAIAYFFRLRELAPKSSRVLPVSDGKRFLEVVVRTGERELLSLPKGKLWTIPTTPEMKNLGGVFNKSPKGLLRVWYSDDFRKIPVRVSSKVVVGDFVASLTKATPPIELP